MKFAYRNQRKKFWLHHLLMLFLGYLSQKHCLEWGLIHMAFIKEMLPGETDKGEAGEGWDEIKDMIWSEVPISVWSHRELWSMLLLRVCSARQGSWVCTQLCPSVMGMSCPRKNMNIQVLLALCLCWAVARGETDLGRSGWALWDSAYTLHFNILFPYL